MHDGSGEACFSPDPIKLDFLIRRRFIELLPPPRQRRIVGQLTVCNGGVLHCTGACLQCADCRVLAQGVLLGICQCQCRQAGCGRK